jgi:hypothetical protein
MADPRALRREPMTPDKQGLKKATRALVRAVGGQEACVGFGRMGRHQTYSDYGNPDRPEHFMPIDVVEDLEAVTRGTAGWPQVTRYLASRQGCALVVLPEAVPGDGAFIEALGKLTKEYSDLSGGLCAALADGAVDRADVDKLKLLDEADELIAMAVQMRALIEAAAGS